MDMLQLGTFICDNTPYPPMRVVINDGYEVEWDAQPVVWDFRGEGKRVGKAIRIPIEITYESHTYKDWLLIGYEGSAGD